MEKKRIIIAVDGHSSCGKSTLAKELAGRLGYTYIDSGAMYRAVTLFVIQNNVDIYSMVEIEAALEQIKIHFDKGENGLNNATYLNGLNIESEIRGLEVSNMVSPVATIPEVRKSMVDLQREMSKEKGVVMDGRDIGSHVFPDAELKIFMTASIEIRAKRRFEELTSKGQDVSYDDVLKNLTDRDRIDSSRKTNPLIQVEEAKVIDNTDIDREAQLKIALDWANELINQ